MFKVKFSAIALAVVLCASVFVPVRAAARVRTDTVGIVISGAVSGYGLARAFNKMQLRGINPTVATLVVAAMVPVAYGIRTTLVPAATKQADAMGLLAAVTAFFAAL